MKPNRQPTKRCLALTLVLSALAGGTALAIADPAAAGIHCSGTVPGSVLPDCVSCRLMQGGPVGVECKTPFAIK